MWIGHRKPGLRGGLSLGSEKRELGLGEGSLKLAGLFLAGHDRYSLGAFSEEYECAPEGRTRQQLD